MPQFIFSIVVGVLAGCATTGKAVAQLEGETDPIRAFANDGVRALDAL